MGQTRLGRFDHRAGAALGVLVHAHAGPQTRRGGLPAVDGAAQHVRAGRTADCRSHAAGQPPDGLRAERLPISVRRRGPPAIRSLRSRDVRRGHRRAPPRHHRPVRHPWCRFRHARVPSAPPGADPLLRGGCFEVPTPKLLGTSERRVCQSPTIFSVTGEEDYLLHVAVADADHLHTFIIDRLGSRPKVDHVRTAIVYQHLRKAVLEPLD